MSKYLTVFRISFQQEFVYRLNFVMWRVRNVLQVFLIFFLWDTVFSNPNTVIFGYDRSKILTYVFALMIAKAFVLSSRSVDIAGEVSQGLLTNYLVRPVNYFKYWFARDLSSKALNLIFVSLEVGALFIILKPPFFFQTNLAQLGLTIVSLSIAICLFFLLLAVFNLFPLWYPEQAWGATFLLLIFVDFLGGGVFPLDILPPFLQKIIYLTPFPYLLFTPIQIYLGKVGLVESLKAIGISLVWLIILIRVLQGVWKVGLKVYRSEGR
ncbi:hypothetical protein A3D00_00990 [Candidatus Woesebacteria bacterium RIFCSPHIGHO2_02_FULL_38_9]|uniref:ABC transporter permease n=1 Tax=Candidatus Woesebacteria bacterium RIFCSPHIGHO2_01_FULL_39_28 TaxID=1802496 RepID=A0A1F7YHC5_9BACT|nr:MAG: hypothetical protein A2627_01405 [Candidatus Woesebacteria bacterium RIFCSPHIGHO2_01_FULL_39_28]OGM31700.1 MAG: hypothetical protein A3D00_00990 [Candidatus Woesebacteria bacterium RIFCSPHIGHO2_02_FULL_38_9]OGM57639.1 MAG: hypothetical protein A3A50_01365 [Candidatus Woesebacteria bacterium RIFCSPLOWO2_01_FULL_38_20]